MINHSETLTDGIHQILFGIHKPDRELERYEQQLADSDLHHYLVSFPSSPAAYTDLHGTIRARWIRFLTDHEDMFLKWTPSFYTMPDDRSGAFHILCDFYSYFIRAECRMMIQVSEAQKESLAISTLKFETLTLRNELLDLIRETANRLQRVQPDTLEGDLNQFVLKQLRDNLLITFLELQKRSAHLFKNRIISKRELFLKHLNQPEPDPTPWHRTVTLTEFELEEALRTPEIPDQLHSVEDLLMTVRSESSGHGSRVENSVSLLENVWFCLFMIHKTGIWDTLDLNDANQCSQNIEEIHQALYQDSSENNSTSSAEIIQTVIYCFDNIQKVLNDRRTECTSSACRLIRSIKAHYEGGSEVPNGAQPELNRAMVVREVPESSILDQYIPVDQIKEKLGVTHKSMNKYLSKSKTPVHKFSNKTQLISVDDFNTMMDHFKTTI